MFRQVILAFIITIPACSLNPAQLHEVFVWTSEGVIEPDVDVPRVLNSEPYTTCHSRELIVFTPNCCHLEITLLDFCWPALLPSTRFEIEVLDQDILTRIVDETQLKTSPFFETSPCRSKLRNVFGTEAVNALRWKLASFFWVCQYDVHQISILYLNVIVSDKYGKKLVLIHRGRYHQQKPQGQHCLDHSMYQNMFIYKSKVKKFICIRKNIKRQSTLVQNHIPLSLNTDDNFVTWWRSSQTIKHVLTPRAAKSSLIKRTLTHFDSFPSQPLVFQIPGNFYLMTSLISHENHKIKMLSGVQEANQKDYHHERH